MPRSSHGGWEPAKGRKVPVKLLEDQAKSRVPELVPIRYGRMLASPFTFFRGAAAIISTVREYREAMRGFAAMGNLDVWYARLDVDALLANLAPVADRRQMKAAEKNVAKAQKKNSGRPLPPLRRAR